MAVANTTRGSVLFNPRFLLLCLYVMSYLAVRGYGEIVVLGANPLFGRQTAGTQIVEPASQIPRWRRQGYRVVFSPLIVAEEEILRLKAKGANLVEEAGDYGRNFLPN